MPWGPAGVTIGAVAQTGIIVDLSAAMRRITIVRGKSDEAGQYPPGRITIELDNPLGHLSPSNTSSPLYPNVVPGAPIYVDATRTAPTTQNRALFAGWAESWQDVPGKHGDMRASTVVVEAFDVLGLLAAVDGVAVDPPIREGELAGDRVGYLAGIAQVPSWTLDLLSTGTIPLQATDTSSNVLDEIYLCADSEFGAVYGIPSGHLIFDDRFSLVTQARCNTVQAVFGDDGGSSLPVLDVEISDASITSVINSTAIGRRDGVIQTSEDTGSIASYGLRRYSRTDLICQSDAHCKGIADTIVVAKAQPDQRITQVTFDACASANHMVQAMDRELRDRIQVRKRMPGGWTLQRDCFITRIEHEITATTWRVTYGLVSTRNIETAAALVGTAVVGTDTLYY